jgi:hypothetical protein
MLFPGETPVRRQGMSETPMLHRSAPAGSSGCGRGLFKLTPMQRSRGRHQIFSGV